MSRNGGPGTPTNSDPNGRGIWPDGYSGCSESGLGENDEHLRVAEQARTTKNADNGVRNESPGHSDGSPNGVSSLAGGDSHIKSESEEKFLAENDGSASVQQNGGKSGLDHVEGGDASDTQRQKFNYRDQRQGPETRTFLFRF